MALQKGDVVTLSASPTIPLAPYINLKPSASITVTLGDDIVSTIDRAKSDLRRLLLQSAAIELGVSNDLSAALKSGDLEGYIEKELNHGHEGSTHSSGNRTDEVGVPVKANKGPVRQGPIKQGPQRKG